MKYIGVKLIEAEPMTRGEYNTFRGWTIPADENPCDEGYKVKYSDSYVSWTPKEIFDTSHLPLTDPEGNSIREDDVRNFIAKATPAKSGDKTTILHVILKNGYVIVESSSCVDPANYNEDMGGSICLDRAKNTIWSLLGFLLQCAKGGMKQ